MGILAWGGAGFNEGCPLGSADRLRCPHAKSWVFSRRTSFRERQLFRLKEEEGHVSHLGSYGFCPATIRVVGEELGLRVRTGIYRAPSPAPGRYYGDPDGSGEGEG